VREHVVVLAERLEEQPFALPNLFRAREHGIVACRQAYRNVLARARLGEIAREGRAQPGGVPQRADRLDFGRRGRLDAGARGRHVVRDGIE
jgi:hypothetical protein